MAAARVSRSTRQPVAATGLGISGLAHLVGAAGEALNVAMAYGVQLAARLAKLTDRGFLDRDAMLVDRA